MVFIHGLNLAPGIVHFEMGQRLAEAIARRREPGPGFNVLAWDWNAATFAGLRSRANEEVAVQQGGALAAALRRAGIAPGRTHLIGHSSGCIVAVSAARGLAAGPGQAVARLTLLDPAAIHHPLVFDQLAAGSSALRVENFWTPGPSGYGREAARAGVRDVRIDGPSPYLGLVRPSRSNHLHLVQWYLQTAGDVTIPAGFNASIPRLEMAPR